jgi:hypothetical protein
MSKVRVNPGARLLQPSAAAPEVLRGTLVGERFSFARGELMFSTAPSL